MRLSFLLCFIICISWTIKGQSKFTLHANVGAGLYGFSNNQEKDFVAYQYKQIYTYPAKSGFSAGLDLTYTILSKWRLSAGIDYLLFDTNESELLQFYDENRVIYSEAIRTKDQQVQALQIPFQASYLILNKKNQLSIDLGFITSFLLESELHFYEDEQYQFIVNTSENNVSFDKNIDFLGSAGFTFKPFNKVAFRIAYEHDIAPNFASWLHWDEDVFIYDIFDLHISSVKFEIIYQISAFSNKS